MSIRRLGEFGLIERFRKAIKTDPSVIKGSGDDCAVMRFDKKHYMLFTCDMLIEGIDFTSKEDPFLVGRKAIAVSISDIASCCGLPRYCTVSMALPRRSKVLTADKLFKGMYDICRQYGINLVGGDLSRADKLIIDVSMLGFVEKNRLCLRSKAKKGDVIFVTGEFGGSIKGKHLRFIPRVDEARFLSERFKVNSMIDISDGLTQDLSHILKASSVGALIYEDLIPASKEARDLTDVLSSGEDF
ncbi:MAG: thiamine-phosphate kinase, partial [Candidatus Omnitrophica bacterium]|nr:thiamine-phosphate kinase [Candidatus Omnitrophota bacterium]